MTPNSPSPSPTPKLSPVRLPPAQATAARPSRLLSGIYHDIGMAAVAMSLELAFEGLEPAIYDSVKRGARYIYLMPKREPQMQAAE